MKYRSPSYFEDLISHVVYCPLLYWAWLIQTLSICSIAGSLSKFLTLVRNHLPALLSVTENLNENRISLHCQATLDWNLTVESEVLGSSPLDRRHPKIVFPEIYFQQSCDSFPPLVSYHSIHFALRGLLIRQFSPWLFISFASVFAVYLYHLYLSCLAAPLFCLFFGQRFALVDRTGNFRSASYSLEMNYNLMFNNL